MKFHVTVHRDEDGVWIVECPVIPGCVSQGTTKNQALNNIREAIALCLEVRAEKGMRLQSDLSLFGHLVLPERGNDISDVRY